MKTDRRSLPPALPGTARTAVVVLTLLAATATGADTVELRSGSKVEGRVLSRDATSVTVETVMGGRTFKRTYPLDRIEAITRNGQREIIAAPSAAPSEEASRSATASSRSSRPKEAAPPRRTRAEVEKHIEEMGRTQPDWWGQVPLDYPRSLDLSYPQRPTGEWNNQRNVGQYVWDIVNPNPDRWRSGVRLMHHLLTVNQNNAATCQRVMQQLGTMYLHLVQDPARAAFWWQQAGVDRQERASAQAVYLAECYWRLGSKEMAVELLQRIPPHFASIKLWADMGETDYALRMAEANSRGAAADLALLYAGDACRLAGQYDDALACYQRILEIPLTGQARRRIERNQVRARASIEAIRLFDALDLGKVPDGKYRASSIGYQDEVVVEVAVRGGRIERVEVVEHHEKQFYSSIEETTQKIVARQDVKGIDTTSGATITSEAIIHATAKALAKAQR